MPQTAELRILELETDLERKCAALNTERVTRMRQGDQIRTFLSLVSEITGVEHQTLEAVGETVKELFEMKIEGVAQEVKQQ